MISRSEDITQLEEWDSEAQYLMHSVTFSFPSVSSERLRCCRFQPTGVNMSTLVDPLPAETLLS